MIPFVFAEYADAVSPENEASNSSPRPQFLNSYHPSFNNVTILPDMDMPQEMMNSNLQMPMSSTSNIHSYAQQHSDHVGMLHLNTPLPENSLINQPFQPEIQPEYSPNVAPPVYPPFFMYNTNEPHFQEPRTPIRRIRKTESQPAITAQWTEPLTTTHSHSLKRSRSASPIIYDFVMEDPTNPHGYREKRVRSKGELDKQKEDIRQLKQYGGACRACYNSKKKCGPSTPCPPCLANKRECVRKETSPSDQKSPRTSDAELSSSPILDPRVFEILDTMDPNPWELIGSIDGSYCDIEPGSGCDIDLGE